MEKGNPGPPGSPGLSGEEGQKGKDSSNVTPDLLKSRNKCFYLYKTTVFMCLVTFSTPAA